MKKKCCFIIPYFGKLPNSFSVFLKTCSMNPDFNWLLLTDDRQKFEYPANVQVKYMFLQDVAKLADSKFGFHVALDKAYKLCDFKPAYGYIFEDFIQEYEFWGHCDIDIILGKISHFLTREILDRYDKFFCMGHMIVYRNTFENNRVFMNTYNNRKLYKDVFTTPEICWFDEEWNGENNINRIFLASGKSVLQEDWSANFNVNVQNFERNLLYADNLTGKIVHTCEGKINALYYWYNGGAYRLYINDGKLTKEEFLYMHFQWRNMHFDKRILSSQLFKIVPNSFLTLESIPETVSEFNKIRKNTICFYSFNRWFKNSVIRRIKKLFKLLNIRRKK